MERMAGIELRKEVAEGITDVGFGAVVKVAVNVPNGSDHTNRNDGRDSYYTRLFIEVVRAGDNVTVGACYRSVLDEVADTVKIVSVRMARDGSMTYLMEEGVADSLMRIKPSNSGALSFCFPNVQLRLKNAEGLAVFQFSGVAVPSSMPNEIRESSSRAGSFEFKTVTAGRAALLRLHELVTLKKAPVREARPQPNGAARPLANRSALS